MKPPRRQRVAGAAILLLTALLAPTVPATPATAAPPAPTAQASDQVTVTLVTGDAVEVRKLANGQYTADPRAAVRPAGSPPVSFTKLGTPTGDLYVFPSDAFAQVSTGALDRELFNVRRLVEAGYTDKQTRQLPVIVQFGNDGSAANLARQADDLPATTGVTGLRSVHGAGARVDKARAGDFWNRVHASAATGPTAGPPSLAAGVTRIWLDRPVRSLLDQSVAQIGAPAAWQAGFDGTGVTVAILDTGLDETHPDLAGKVVARQNFTTAASTADGFGHGTHVASILAGTGAASGGKYKGVAPGTRLMIGKVIGDDNYGSDSWVIAGMEWATSNGARIVNMSLGGDFSDGYDPLSLAVDQLTASTGALFVIAAGNSGQSGARSVTSPGSAVRALTVGAVDKSDRLAWFSSRGPLTRSIALKPDITAPGVDIVAARAAGTGLGTPVNDRYTTLSGTSMATPHVAGAASILLQEHPDWQADQLKAVLTGSAVPNPTLTAYEQGAGRLDVSRAIHQRVLAGPASLDFGPVTQPATQPLIRTVTLTNTGDTAVNAEVTATLTDPDGAAVHPTVVPATLALPAHGSAQVQVTFDPANRPLGAYSGALAVVDSTGVSLVRVAAAAYIRPPGHNLRVNIVPPKNWGIDRMFDFWGLLVLRVDAPADIIMVGRKVPFVDIYVDDGTYEVATAFLTMDADTGAYTTTALFDPEVVVKGADRETTLDGAAAKPVTVQTPRPSELHSADQILTRGTAYGGSYWLENTSEWRQLGPPQLRVSPTKPVTVGTLRWSTQLDLGEQLASVQVLGRRGGPAPTLHPLWTSYQFADQRVALDRPAELVDVGTGSDAEIARARVRGRMALLRIDWRVTGYVNDLPAGAVLTRLRDAGALAVIVYTTQGLILWCGPAQYDGNTTCPQTIALPTLILGPGEAAALVALAAGGPVPVYVRTRPAVTYTYRLRFDHDGFVPDPPTYRVREDHLAEVTSRLHQAGVPTDLARVTNSVDGLGLALVTDTLLDGGPREITDYVGPVSSGILWETAYVGVPRANRDDPVTSANNVAEFGLNIYARAGHRTEDWMLPHSVGAMRIGVADSPLWKSRTDVCLFCRGYQNLTAIPVQTFGDGSHWGTFVGYGDGATTEVHLLRDGQEVPALSPFGWDLSGYPQAARYRLTQHSAGGVSPYSTDVSTAWDFTSMAPSAPTPGILCLFQPTDPAPTDNCRVESLLMLGYGLESVVSLNNTARAGGDARMVVTVYEQNGAAPTAVKGLQLQVSYDRGAHWRPVSVQSLGNGRYQARYDHPWAKDGTTVSLRAQAWDGAGNRVEQTMLDVYLLVR